MKASDFLRSGGNYIKGDDVKAGPQKFEIEAVEAAETPDKKPAIGLVFKGGKRLTLNKTNGRLLMGTYGDDTNEWVGKRIVVSFDPTVMFSGKMVGGVRVRPLIPQGVVQQAAATQEIDPELGF